MNRVILILILFSTEVLADDQEIKIIDVKPKIISAIELKKNMPVGDIRAGGTATDVCRIQNYRGLYSAKAGTESAKRDFSEGSVKYYGVANGIGPTYPGQRCSSFNDYETIIIWPTTGCKHDLKFNNAFAFASSYNSTIYGLLCIEGT